MSITGGDAPGFHPVLAGVLLSEETVSGLLTMIVELASSAVTGVDGASISLVVSSGDRLVTSNATSPDVRTADEAQYEGGAGPCVEAIRTGSEVVVRLPVEQWPTLSERAAQAGMAAVMSLPLQVLDRTTGALNLYSKARGRA